MKRIYFIIAFLLSSMCLFSQTSPDELYDGLKTPFIRFYNLTTAEISALTPEEGDLVYNTDTKTLQFNDGTNWKMFQKKIQTYTTVERDALTPINFEIIYNSTSSELQYWDGDSWEVLGGTGGNTEGVNSSGTIAGNNLILSLGDNTGASDALVTINQATEILTLNFASGVNITGGNLDLGANIITSSGSAINPTDVPNLGQVNSLITGIATPTLQQVTDSGNSSTNNIQIIGVTPEITVENQTQSNSVSGLNADTSTGFLSLGNSAGFIAKLKATNLAADLDVEITNIPLKSGASNAFSNTNTFTGITNLNGQIFINNLVDLNTNRLQNLGNPINPNDATNKTYVDAAIGGIAIPTLDQVLAQGVTSPNRAVSLTGNSSLNVISSTHNFGLADGFTVDDNSTNNFIGINGNDIQFFDNTSGFSTTLKYVTPTGNFNFSIPALSANEIAASQTYVDNAVAGVSGGGGSSNPKVYVVDDITDIQGDLSAHANKQFDIQGTFTCDEAVSFPDNVAFTDGGGKITFAENARVTFINPQFATYTDNAIFDFLTYTKSTANLTAVGGETTWDLGFKVDPKFPIELTIDGVVQLQGTNGALNENFTISYGATTVITFQNSFSPLTAGQAVVFNYTPFESYPIITDASTFKSSNINLLNFGLVGDGTLKPNTGTDNRNVFLQAQKIYNYNGGVGNGYIDVKAVYMTSLVRSEQYGNTPYNLYTTGSSTLNTNNGSKIAALPNSLNHSDLITIYKPDHVEMTLNVSGDLFDHNFRDPLSSWNHGIIIQGGGDFVKIHNSEISDFSGSGVHGRYESQLVYVSTFVESYFTKSFDLSIADGSTNSNTRYAYSNRTDITSSLFTDVGSLAFGGGSFGGQVGLDVQKYKVVFYDSTGSASDTTTGFISSTDWVETYTAIDIPDNADFCRIVIFAPNDWSGLDASLIAVSQVKNVILDNIDISWCMYHATSNLPRGVNILNSFIHETGQNYAGQNGSPGFGINFEDGYEYFAYMYLYNVTFRNSTMGHIIFKSSKYYTVDSCKFLRSTDSRFTGHAIGMEFSYSGTFTRNLVEDAWISLGNETTLTQSTLKDTDLKFALKDEIVKDNIDTENVRFSLYSTLGAGNATVKDNIFKYPNPLLSSAYVFAGVDDRFSYENNTFDFMGQEWNTTTKRLSTSFSGKTAPAKGVWKNTNIVNLVSGDAIIGNEGFKWAAIKEVSDSEIGINWEIIGGTPQDIVWKNNNRVGWIRGTFSDYPTTNTGTFTTFSIINDNQKFYNFYNLNGSYAFDIAAVDVNLYVEGGTTHINTTTIYGQENNWLRLHNYGTKIFKNKTFKSDVAATQDLGSGAVTGGALYFIDCTFDNVTFTNLRSTDKYLYTKPHADMPVYADNAAALADGYLVGYMYRTSTGDVKTTY